MNITEGILQAFATNDKINACLIRGVPEPAWNLKPASGKGRSIAKIFAHMHNVRLMWLASLDKTAALPAKLEGEEFSSDRVVAALEQSCSALMNRLAASIAGDGKIRGFKPDAVSFFAYLIAHDAHHRGQVALLARELGHPVPKNVLFGLWEWDTRGRKK